MATLCTIPQPPTVPFLANTPLMDREHPNETFKLLADQYGEIYQFKFPDGRTVVHINTYKLLAQISDDKRFKKVVTSPLNQVRDLVGDGLFTGELEEANWGIAHRILMPAFGPANTVNMFEDMKDICGQLLLKWERFGPDTAFDPAEDFTRLTFDTIALCSMSYRFNSFYDMKMPKFTQEMVDVLIEGTQRAYRSPFTKILSFVNKASDDKYFAQIKDMRDTATEIVLKRRQNPIEKKDILTLMLEGKDPKTGEGLSDIALVNNLITFLVAGHETTSGMLTFTTYHLLRNPSVLIKLREELDQVLSGEDLRLEHLDKLEYLTAVMRESLRLSPTATARSVMPFGNTFLVGGDGDESNPENKKYEVKEGIAIMTHAPLTQTDPFVWGDDAELFRPERMLDGKFENLPAHAWQPFGFGLRGCIGRPFAWQEAKLVLASIFSKFDVFFADPAYKLRIKQTMTVKPEGLHICVRPRSSLKAVLLAGHPFTAIPTPTAGDTALILNQKEKKTIYVFYGSNSGSSEAFAGRIASDAVSRGFKSKISILDSVTSSIPINVDGPVIIVTSSYEGEPADNATLFVSWLQNLSNNTDGAALKGVSYAVFGCGNHEWARTYQRIPKLCDTLLERNGAERLLERGESDAASVSFFQSFEIWETMLWEKLDGDSERSNTHDSPATSSTFLKVEIIEKGSGRAKLLRQADAALAKVSGNTLLTRSDRDISAKRHIEFELPDGMVYRAGDYLAILPENPSEVVDRVLQRFALLTDQEIIIRSESSITLPANAPITCGELLRGYVELTQPATTRDIQNLESLTTSETTITSLKSLREDFGASIVSRRISVLDLLEQHSDILISFETFLQMLPPMRIRQYSISSSPLADAKHVSLTISVVDAEARSGSAHRHLGVASNYLASLHIGDRVPVVVRASGAAFHLPSDPLIPVIMFCCGSGIAPFRGFIQERAIQVASGRSVGKMLLFFGCRAPEDDFLYSDSDLKKWVNDGVVDVRPAFSRKINDSEGCRYVQDRIWHSREDIIKLYRQGAKLYTCGSRKASEGIRQVCINILKHARPEISDDEASREFESIQKERYATDVFD